MSAHAVILLLCVVLAASSVMMVWLITKLLSVKKDLAAETLAHGNTAQTLVTTNARLSEIEKKGGEMYLELQSRAYQSEYRSRIVGCLERRIADLVSQAALMSAKTFAAEKKAIGASIVEFLLAALFSGSCGRTNAV